MLDAAGLLRARRRLRRSRRRRRTPARRARDADDHLPAARRGGEIEATVTVDDRGDMQFLLDPQRDLRARSSRRDGRWRAWLGGTELPGDYSGPRSAKRACGTPLRDLPDGQWAVALLDRLFRESFRL